MTKSNAKKRNVVIVAALCMVMAIGGIMAYFTADDSAKNTFTMGKVTIDLSPEDDAVNTTNVTPNQEIAMTPNITNTGKNAAYVFIKVEVPKAYVTTANAKTGVRNADSTTKTQLFQFNKDAKGSASMAWTGTDTVVNSWTLVASDTDDTKSVNTYVYAYGTSTACTSLAAEATTSNLFNSVTFANVVEHNGEKVSSSSDYETLTEQGKDFKLYGYAIQADNIANDEDGATNYQTAPKKVWNILAKQQTYTPAAK